MKLLPSRFYPIASTISQVETLIDMDVDFLQLRVKDLPESVVREISITCMDMCDTSGTLMILNDYWKIALDLGIEFVHLGSEDLVLADIHSLKLANVRFGISTHDDNELKAALASEPDYIALGPIFTTLSKKMSFAPQGQEKLKKWKDIIKDIPLVAIGGMTPERAVTSLDFGADSISVIGDIWNNNNPKARIREWKTLDNL